MEDSQAIMIDVGSYNIKAGFAGEDAPKVVIPTLIGRAKFPGILVGMESKDFYVGNEAKSKKHLLDLSEPVQKGLIANFEDMEHVLADMMNNDLKCAFDD